MYLSAPILSEGLSFRRQFKFKKQPVKRIICRMPRFKVTFNEKTN